MVVQHNLTAMNSNRMLNLTVNSQAKSTEKLSSGYKINRAADDAAGLAISEKMRKQIRGLTRASENAQDGISAVQTAEGALNEVQDMLQRMNELAVQSANGTNSTTDRNAIQDEVDQLLTEIDRVSETTKFNETYLLKGDSSATKTISLEPHDAGLEGTWAALTGDDAGKYTFTVTALAEGDTISIGGQNYTIIADDGTEDTANGQVKAATAYTYMANALTEANSIGGTGEVSAANNVFTITPATATVNKALSFNLHVGADADMTNKIGVQIEQMNSSYLGINGLNVVSTDTDTADDDSSAATYAIDAITDALQKVSDQRAALGAVQNRLEHTINNLDNVVENTTSAESQIRDTDMATEMVT
nr:flagellar hook protein [Lachnospiraceae bacterium]